MGCVKGMQGLQEDWAAFHCLLGRYLVAAANAELHLWLLLQDLQRVAGVPLETKPTMWGASVKKLTSLPETPFTAEVVSLMKGAARRGKLRNHNVHNAWFSVSADNYVGRRALPDGQPGAFLLLDRETLVRDIVVMEKFSDDLWDLRGKTQRCRPPT